MFARTVDPTAHLLRPTSKIAPPTLNNIRNHRYVLLTNVVDMRLVTNVADVYFVNEYRRNCLITNGNECRRYVLIASVADMFC